MARRIPVTNRGSVAITPDTKIGELLSSYPQLEEALVDLSPTFRKLQNPVLRRTVAKVTTLRHAAKVGGVDLATMINGLRAAAGLNEEFHDDTPHSSEGSLIPSWFRDERVTRRVDVGPLLEAGEKPVATVMRDLTEFPSGEIYEVTAPFLPAPLIDLARKQGFEAWWQREGEQVIRVYFHRSSPETLVSLDQ
jgi:hypothetical protein